MFGQEGATQTRQLSIVAEMSAPILVGMLLPAIQAARESALRPQNISHIKVFSGNSGL
jgi:hypothetical protein